jgi:YD repeat-containing protein
LHAVASITLALLLAILPAAAFAQQGGATRYVYDDNGRLRAVISPAGEAAVYEYDAAGNFTRIRRLAATALELLDFFPKQGLPDDLVTFLGVGFGDGVTAISFNGATAQIIETTVTTVVAKVPQAATTGLVTIMTPRGQVMTAVPFTIKGVRVSPATARIFPSDTVQFTAVVAVPGPDQSITWSVNGVNGGNATVGTITAAGLYTAPNQPNQPASVFTVRATSVADSSLFSESEVIVQDRSLISTLVSSGLSVRRGLAPGDVSSTAVSVQRGLAPGEIIGAGISVQREPLPGMVSSLGVSVTNGPQISSISPDTFTKGATTSLTINGTNFGGTTALSFITVDGALDSMITVSGLSVNGSGTSLTANITVSASAATGRRIVILSGSAGNSPSADLGVNTVGIVP